jgi:hypothetical protein
VSEEILMAGCGCVLMLIGGVVGVFAGVYLADTVGPGQSAEQTWGFFGFLAGMLILPWLASMFIGGARKG